MNEAQKCQEQLAEFRQILENSTAVIYLKDIDGRYLFINRQYEKLFHISLEKIIGKKDHDIFPKEAADSFRKNDLEVLRKKTSMEIEEYVPQNDELHTYISIKFPLVSGAEEFYGVCGISTDITERKKLEKKLQAYNQRLEAEVAERTKELQTKIAELELINKSMVGRELKMIELKEEIARLKKQSA